MVHRVDLSTWFVVECCRLKHPISLSLHDLVQTLWQEIGSAEEKQLEAACTLALQRADLYREDAASAHTLTKPTRSSGTKDLIHLVWSPTLLVAHIFVGKWNSICCPPAHGHPIFHASPFLEEKSNASNKGK